VELFEVVVAVIAGGLITQLIGVYRARGDARRDDRKQAADESSGAATAAKTITDAAESIVKLQDAQADELKALIEQQRKEMQARLDAQGAELSAYNTRMDHEIQKRLRAEAQAKSIEDQVNQLREKLASMGAQFEIADQERVALRRENGAMKTQIFSMAVGIGALTRQVVGAGLEPEYALDVLLTSTGRLGPIDVEAVKNY
jgi:ATPase subunit of ABC transporter with duplicated ATPase domains